MLLETTLQLILVTTPDWQSQTGQMVRFERESLDLPFSEHGTAIPIVVGQGDGLGHRTSSIPT